ncbi:TRAP transporter large permease [Salinibacillus xinjiangensis]|uniref:TRAP transporter large permease subunit n=1 Tax=Salinibacillus xinjiangensis TaxID=1229268 RepID=A0A6G1X1H6_9BACI|nr:TRAP transporter large permease [Salinibacillus xinjiangensis]MRG84847.1 TRAP transporter large permease subunit [Salinibacillus xinjiangensis]
MIIGISVVIVLLLLASGMEIGIAMGLAGILLLLFHVNIPISVISHEVLNAVDSYTLLAIPFFILAGNLMMEGRLADRLMDFFGSFMRFIRGGLGVGAMLASVFFAAISGSSVASAAALSKTITESLQKENYAKNFTAGIVAVGGTLGLMIPPSLTFILIGTMIGIPVRDLFVAGITPGILEGLLLIFMTYFISRKYKYGYKRKVKMREVSSSFGKSSAAILLPIIILGGIYLGIFTPTEVSVVAAIYALFVCVFIYKSIKLVKLPKIIKDTIYSTSMIYLVLIGGTLLSFILTRLGVANTILSFIQGMDLPVWGFLLLINVVLLALGMFLDGISLIVILAPLLFPVASGMGINPIHFAVIMVANIEIATITPPVGLNLYVVSGVSKLKVSDVVKGVIPFYFVRLAGLLLITFIPTLSLWLL